MENTETAQSKGTYFRPMVRQRAKVDINQRRVVMTLRGVPGVKIRHLHMVGKGCPDLLIGYKGRNYLIELKPDDKAPLTEDEQDFIAGWTGQVAVCTGPVQILEVIGALKIKQGASSKKRRFPR